MNNSHTTVYYVHAGSRNATWTTDEQHFKNMRAWCKERGMSYSMTNNIGTRQVTVYNDLDKVAFKLKYGSYIYKERNV